MDETVPLHKKHGTQEPTLPTAGTGGIPSSKPHYSRGASSCLTATPTQPLHLFQILHLHPFANSHISPTAAPLIRTLDASNLAGLRPTGFESFLSFVPARLGHNAALDDAVECLVTLYSTLFLPDHHTKNRHRSKYVQALASLRGCLADSSIALSSETLCATLLLSIYEVSSPHSAGGLSLMIPMSGPRQSRWAFDAESHAWGKRADSGSRPSATRGTLR